MRFYLVSINDIPNKNGDEKFGDFIIKSKFEWWRYMPLVWIIATPDNVSTNNILKEVTNAYGVIFTLVLEISINDVAGLFPASKEMKDEMPEGWSPFNWFHAIRDKEYVPLWEKKPNF